MRPSTAPAGSPVSPRNRIADDAGWVLVPVMALLAIGLVLCFAALLLVDRQTQAAAGERTADAAETLAEGVATATASVLAGDESNPVWLAKFTACQSVTGNLAGPPAAGTPRTLTSAVQTAVNAHFDAATAAGAARLSEYDTRGGRATTWRVRICPTTDTAATPDTRWTRTRATTWTGTGVNTGSLDRRQTLWVIGQGNVRKDAGTAGPGQVRAVAAKVQRGSSLWKPPTAFGLATGSYDNDLGAVTGQVLGNVTQAVGQDILKGVLGTEGLLGRRDDLISDSTTDPDTTKGSIGVRCGLLQGADNLVKHVATAPLDLTKLDLNLCLAGSFAGLNGVTGRLGLNTLLDPVLGTNRFQNLDGFSIAPTGVVDAYRDEAKAGAPGAVAGTVTGVWKEQIAGSTYNPATSSTVTECDIPWNQVNDKTIVFIEQVGTGDQSCAIGADKLVNVRALVVNRGRIVVRGRLNGVLYALNGQECASAGSAGCTAEYRANQPTREIVRIEGGKLADGTKVGRVTGTVWVDGVRGRVGLYPASTATSFGGALGPLLSSVASPVDTTLCSMPIVGPLVAGITKLLSDVLTGITGGAEVVALAAGSVGPPATDASKNTCGIVKAAIGSLANVPALATLVSNGGKVDYLYDEWQKCIPGVLNLGCLGVGTDWRKTKVNQTSNATIDKGLLTSLLTLGPISNLQTLLTSLSSDTTPLIVRDTNLIAAAKANVADNAVFVPGTFRSLPPEA